jgi:hypothetical protein
MKFGPVEVIKGKFKGKIGYYDDDDWDEKDCNVAVVYFDEPFSGPYYLLSHSWLKPTTVRHLPLERWIRENPELARQMGIS